MGWPWRVGAGGFHTDIQRHLANLENDLTQNMRALLNDLLDDLAYIENRVKALSAKIEAIAKEDETISRLLTIPGIGALGATALVAAAGDGRQFRKARDMAASRARGTTRPPFARQANAQHSPRGGTPPSACRKIARNWGSLYLVIFI